LGRRKEEINAETLRAQREKELKKRNAKGRSLRKEKSKERKRVRKEKSKERKE
jgi:hypothetical protein